MVAITLRDSRWVPLTARDWPVIGSHLLFLHNLIPSHATQIDFPVWSIGLEVQLYLAFPLLVWAFRRARATFVLATTVALALAVRVAHSRLPDALGAVLRDGPLPTLRCSRWACLRRRLPSGGDSPFRDGFSSALSLRVSSSFGRGAATA